MDMNSKEFKSSIVGMSLFLSDRINFSLFALFSLLSYSRFSDNTAFTQDLSNWNVRNAQDRTEMCYGATSFSQNLCSRGPLMAANVVLRSMFRGTACPETADPVKTETGYSPMCYECP